MPECTNCGSHVTPTFVRVYGKDGIVKSCTSCTTKNFDRDKDGRDFDRKGRMKTYARPIPRRDAMRKRRPFLRMVEAQKRNARENDDD